MFCAFHEKRIAVDKCSKCDAAVCNECQVILKGKIFCKNCCSEPLAGITLTPSRKPFLAAVLSLLVPGLGQVYNGQPGKGLVIFFLFWLVAPWVYGIFDAYRTAERINRLEIATVPSTRDFIAFLLVVLIIFFGIFKTSYDIFYKGSVGQITQRNLAEVARAAEQYSRDKGEYPEKFSQLYFADPPYLEELYCDVELLGYRYTCQFSKKGYVLIAAPVANKGEVYSVSTGGIAAP